MTQYDSRTKWVWDETELLDRAETAEADLARLLDAGSDDPGLRRLVRETLEAHQGAGIDGQTDAVMAVIRVTIAHQVAAIRSGGNDTSLRNSLQDVLESWGIGNGCDLVSFDDIETAQLLGELANAARTALQGDQS